MSADLNASLPRAASMMLVGVMLLSILLGLVAMIPAYAPVVPPRPLTVSETAFDTFGEIWQTAFNNYNIELFERGVKGNRVVFEGTCGGADHTGTQFYLFPRNQPCPCCDFEAVIVLRGKPLPARLREPGARVRVTGRISSVTISSVFIIAETIEVL